MVYAEPVADSSCQAANEMIQAFAVFVLQPFNSVRAGTRGTLPLPLRLRYKLSLECMVTGCKGPSILCTGELCPTDMASLSTVLSSLWIPRDREGTLMKGRLRIKNKTLETRLWSLGL